MEQILKDKVAEAILFLYRKEVDKNLIQVQKTRKEFEGDYTILVFPLVGITGENTKKTGEKIGEYLQKNIDEIDQYNLVKGFLNLLFDRVYWLIRFQDINSTPDYGICKPGKESKTILIEYSSPNTNKPLHLGHIRNNLIGFSLSNILKANGNRVKKVNIVNDRGIHICKSMLAWKKWGNNETPDSSGKKGDHLVGEYYVKFEQEYKKEVEELTVKGFDIESSMKTASLFQEAQEMLRKWEAHHNDVVSLWEKMNGWVYEGFDETYEALGVDFDKIYYESETYELGKSIVLKALNKGLLYSKDDGSVWIDLTHDGLDEKLLLRSDGTSVYITQDIGTAEQRYNEFKFKKQIYVVGNEQNYHFQVLKLILEKLGYKWAKDIYHLSYGMVELPEGRMKSREGKVVDADDLIREMIDTAREMSKELGKLENYAKSRKEEIFKKIGLGALKYFILKVDPRKNMIFNPRESIDFNGNTGTFIQYTYARIQSVLRKAIQKKIEIPEDFNRDFPPNQKEIEIVKLLDLFPVTIIESGESYNPALLANYCYELVKEFNQFYHDFPILKEQNKNIRDFRILLSKKTGEVIAKGMNLLGIEVPERM
jgi:arginyl-tRNA synthetase